MNKSVKASEINRYVDFDDFIAVFDSGMGGISTLIELVRTFSNEKFVYFGDNINAPYGIKSDEEIYHLSDEIVKSFVSAGAKMIVIACNTATSSSIDRLKQDYQIPIIGIEPELEQAVIENKGKNILVMATNATLSGKLYQKKLEHYQQKKGKNVPKSISSIAMPKLIEIVEAGKTSKTDVANVMQEIELELLKSTSAIVLGCTHFVLLRSQIEEFMNDLSVDVKLYEGNARIIRNLQNQLQQSLKMQESSETQFDFGEKELEKMRNKEYYSYLHEQKKLILLSSDGNKLPRMIDIFNQYFMTPERDHLNALMRSKKFTGRNLEVLLNYVEEFLNEEKLDDLDRELIRSKYIKCNQTNIGMLARSYKKTLKYVRERIVRLDNELFKFLSKKI